MRFEQIVFPRECARLGVDVAHVPYWAGPLRPSVPTVVTIHDLIPLLLREYRGGPLVRLYTALVSTTAQSAALVLTDSEASRRDIVTHLDLPPERVRVVYLAADERYTPAPAPDDGAIRSRYDLPERYVLYLGGFDVRKNVAAVLAAYRWAGPAIGDECPLVIAGRLPERDTPFSPDPRRLAQEHGIDERFVLSSALWMRRTSPLSTGGRWPLSSPAGTRGSACPRWRRWLAARRSWAATFPPSPKWWGTRGCCYRRTTPRGWPGQSFNWRLTRGSGPN